ncbi:MAG: hypothetical protein P1R58_02510 [bacterium]|nr:hypothetical protein [bacterium]
MKSTEFQTESRISTTVLGHDRLSDCVQVRNSISLPAIESLLLGYLLRGRFTDPDKEQLDRMAPSRSIAFILESGKWLHPENLSLFDLALLDPTADQQNGAIFTHFCQPLPGSSQQRHKITTAIINPGSNKPLTLGLLGPDHEISPPYRENLFVSLVDVFRKAFRPAEILAQRVSTKIKPDDAVIVINRASGVVIHASDRAAEICHCPVDALLDREYHQIKESIPAVSQGMSLRLENLTEDDLSISLINIQLPAKKQSVDDQIGLFLIEQSERALHMLRSNGTRDSLRTVIRPSGKISHCLARLKRGLLGYPTAKGNCNLLVTIDNAVRNLIGGHESIYPIQIKTEGSGFILPLTTGEILPVLETAILGHLDRPTRPFQTEIKISAGSPLSLKMTTIASRNSLPLDFHQKWIKQLENFTHICTCSHRRSDGETRLETTLTFKEISTS